MDRGRNDYASYPYAGQLLCCGGPDSKRLPTSAAVPTVWLVVVAQEAHFLSRIVCACRTKAAADARAAAHAAAHSDDRRSTYVTGYQVEARDAALVFIACTSIQVGLVIDAVSVSEAVAKAASRQAMLEAIESGAVEALADSSVMSFHVYEGAA